MFVWYKKSIEQKRNALLLENHSIILTIWKIFLNFYFDYIQMEEVTIFDKIVSGAIKANIVYEDDLVSQ
jgi:hypothetical protein